MKNTRAVTISEMCVLLLIKSINDAWCEFLIVSFTVLYIEHHLADVPGVVLRFYRLLVDEVPLQRRVFDVKNLRIKLL